MTTEAIPIPIDRPRRLHIHWIPDLLFHPGRLFRQVLGTDKPFWFTPMLILSVSAILNIAASGWVRQAAALSGQVELPPEFEYFSPEQQAQFMEAVEATSSPVFLYALPAMGRWIGLLTGWLVIGSLMHLVLTLLGSRGSMGGMLNVVAWASLPFALRDLIRFSSMTLSRQLILNPGLSGFAPASDAGTSLYLVKLLSAVDLFLIWQILLIVIGVRAISGLSRWKIWTAVLFSVLLVLATQALIQYQLASLSGLTIVRPFFF